MCSQGKQSKEGFFEGLIKRKNNFFILFAKIVSPVHHDNNSHWLYP